MELDEALKELQSASGESLLRGVLSTNEWHPIMYFDEFSDSREYELLEALADKNYLHRERNGGKNYVNFYVTDGGKKELGEIFRSVNSFRKRAKS